MTKINDYCDLCDQISHLVADGAGEAVEPFVATHAEDEFLGFALGGDGYVSGFFPVALTAAGLQERMNDFSYGSEGDVLFSFVEWRQSPQSDLLRQASTLADSAYQMISDWEGRSLYMADAVAIFFDAVESGLQACREAGVFPDTTFVDFGGTDRSGMDGRARAALHRLNTPAVAGQAWSHRAQSAIRAIATYGKWDT